jgi:hypothetical protein
MASRRLVSTLSLSIASVLACAARPAHAQPAPVPTAIDASALVLTGTTLVVGSGDGKQVIELGCEGKRAVRSEVHVFVACGAAGVMKLRVAPDGAVAIEERLGFAGEAIDVFEQGDRVWVTLAHLDARPVAEGIPIGSSGGGAPAVLPPIVSAPVSAPAIAPRTGHVVAIEPGKVLVDLGAADQIKVGQRLRFSRATVSDVGTGHETIAVGNVVEVGPTRAKVQLGLNETVDLAAEVEPTEEAATRDMLAPPRPRNEWELGLALRPFLPIGELAFGLVSTFEVGYRGAADWHVRVFGEPFGFAVGGDGPVGAVNVMAAGSYDHPLFEVGLGVGVTRITDRDGSGDGARVTAAFGMTPLVRLGAVDGLHLEVHNGFVLLDEKFRYGSTIGNIRVPIATRLALDFRGGYSQAGGALGEIGLRVLALGNGRAGTVFLTPSVGAAFVFGDRTTIRDGQPTGDEVFYGGPMAGLGAEWRL